MTDVDETVDQVCRHYLSTFFRKFPNPLLQQEAEIALNTIVDCNMPMRGNTGGWAAGILYAVANQFRWPCGIPPLLNKESEEFFHVSMSTVYKRAAKVKTVLALRALVG